MEMIFWYFGQFCTIALDSICFVRIFYAPSFSSHLTFKSDKESRIISLMHFCVSRRQNDAFCPFLLQFFNAHAWSEFHETFSYFYVTLFVCMVMCAKDLQLVNRQQQFSKSRLDKRQSKFEGVTYNTPRNIILASLTNSGYSYKESLLN